MTTWDFAAPPPSELGDHDVSLTGRHLANRRIALLICGGIAAMKTPFLARDLRRQGAEVTAFASCEALRYVAEEALEWSTEHPVITRLTPAAEHLSDAEPFDAYLLPQATYNTINKTARGIADGVLTATLASALGRMERGETSVLIAPAMHGSMHNSVLTESLHRLDRMGVGMIAPRQDAGKNKMPDSAVLVAEVCRALSHSPLCAQRILVTGGPAPVPIDGVSCLTPRFRGHLGIALSEELFLRGAEPLLIHGGSLPVPAHLPHLVAPTFDAYRHLVHEQLADGAWSAGVFTAAVGDFRPGAVTPGKIPSDRALTLELEPTPKIVDEVRARHPELFMMTFKDSEGRSPEALLDMAHGLLDRFDAVVANRSEEIGSGPHVAWLVSADVSPQRLIGKSRIASAIADHLEERLLQLET